MRNLKDTRRTQHWRVASEATLSVCTFDDENAMEPYTLADAPFSALLYLMIAGVVHATIVVVGLILGTPLLHRGQRPYLAFARAFTVFNICLLRRYDHEHNLGFDDLGANLLHK